MALVALFSQGEHYLLFLGRSIALFASIFPFFFYARNELFLAYEGLTLLDELTKKKRSLKEESKSYEIKLEEMKKKHEQIILKYNMTV